MANNQAWAVNGAYECMQALAEHPLWLERDAWRASGGKDGHGLRGTGFALPFAPWPNCFRRCNSNGTCAA